MRSRFLGLYLSSVVALSALCGCGQAGAQVQAVALPQKAPGRYIESVDANGAKRGYVLSVPKAYDASRRLPLVVLLHGWGGNALRMMNYSGMAAKAESEGFVLVAPQGLGNPQGWNVGFIDLSGSDKPDDVGFVTQVMNQVEKEVGIDEDRVYVVGHSNGAMLTHLVGSKLAGRVAAIGAVAGTIGLPGANGSASTTIPAPATPVSAILLHGMADTMVAYDDKHPALLRSLGAPTSAKWWAEKDGCDPTPMHTDGPEVIDDYVAGKDGPEVKLVTYPKGSHDWPANGADLIWEFLKAHPRRRA